MGLSIRIKNPEAFEEKKKEIAEFVLARASENLVKEGAVDTGSLLASGAVEKTESGYRVVFYVDYAWAIEYGSDPHMPPIGPLKGWVGRKLGLRDKEQERAAWTIARNIEKYGTDPRPFLRPAVQEAKAKYAKVVR